MSKAELQKAELEVEINKLKTVEAGLRDALLKMQELNEGLGQDKIELNKIIIQVIDSNVVCVVFSTFEVQHLVIQCLAGVWSVWDRSQSRTVGLFLIPAQLIRLIS